MLFVADGAMRPAASARTATRTAKAARQAKTLPEQRSARKAEPAVKDDDMDDIEAILRKHGIS